MAITLDPHRLLGLANDEANLIGGSQVLTDVDLETMLDNGKPFVFFDCDVEVGSTVTRIWEQAWQGQQTKRLAPTVFVKLLDLRGSGPAVAELLQVGAIVCATVDELKACLKAYLKPIPTDTSRAAQKQEKYPATPMDSALYEVESGVLQEYNQVKDKVKLLHLDGLH